MERATGGSQPPIAAVQWWVEQAATDIELLTVLIIVATIAVATGIYLVRVLRQRADVALYHEYRHRVGRALLLGLEILVAADIIRTVALEPTPRNVLILGLLVIIRTFLSWGLVVEIEGPGPGKLARSPARRKEGVCGPPIRSAHRPKVVLPKCGTQTKLLCTVGSPSRRQAGMS
jgi:uncharacterized membrane protein